MTYNPKLIIVSELFYPDESATAHIITTIADYFKDHYQVQVITGPSTYENEINRQSTSRSNFEKVSIIRVWAPNFDKNRLAQRIIRQLIISAGLIIHVYLQSKPGTLLLSVTNPAPAPVLLALAKKIKKFRYHLLVHDVFPENAIAVGLIRKNSLQHRLSKLIFNWSYNTADKIIVIGRDMAEIIESKIKQKENKINIIENWADEDLKLEKKNEKKIPHQNHDGKIVLGYAGNIGRTQGIFDFLQLITDVKNKEIGFLFAGGGALKEQLTARTKNLKNVALLPAYSRCEQNKIFNCFDIGLILLDNDMYGLGVPSKTYNILAAGKPIIYIGPKNSEIYRLIKENNLGWSFDWSELDAIKNLLNSLNKKNRLEYSKIGDRARHFSLNFTKDISMKKFHKLLKEKIDHF